MDSSMNRLATRAVYGAGQLSRVAWYVGHALTLGNPRHYGARPTGGDPWRPVGADRLQLLLRRDLRPRGGERAWVGPAPHGDGGSGGAQAQPLWPVARYLVVPSA